MRRYEVRVVRMIPHRGDTYWMTLRQMAAMERECRKDYPRLKQPHFAWTLEVPPNQQAPLESRIDSVDELIRGFAAELESGPRVVGVARDDEQFFRPNDPWARADDEYVEIPAERQGSFATLDALESGLLPDGTVFIYERPNDTCFDGYVRTHAQIVN